MINTFGDLYSAIIAILPDAVIEEDYDGQLVVYTNLAEKENGRVIPFTEYDDVDATKPIRFTQSHNLSVTVEAMIPGNWDDDDIREFVKDCAVVVAVTEPDAKYLPRGVTIVGQELDGAEITDAIIW